MRPGSSEHSIQCPVNYEVPRVASGNMHGSWPCASTCDTLSDFWARLSWLWVVSPHTLTQPLSPEDWGLCRSLMASALLSPHWASSCGLPDVAAETRSPGTELVFLSQPLCLLLPDAQVWKIVISYILSYFFLVSDMCVCVCVNSFDFGTILDYEGIAKIVQRISIPPTQLLLMLIS